MVDRFDIRSIFINHKAYSKDEILDQAINIDHTETLKKFKNFGVMSKIDYSRACGALNFTDFYHKKASRSINGNSKYNIIRPKNKGGNVYLTSKLNNIYTELNERYIQKNASCYDSINCRLRGHFIDENVLRFGTKKDGYFFVELQAADLTKLLKKDTYYLPEMSHKEIQLQISYLGYLFGYSSKVARGDKNLDFNGINMTEIATVSSLDLDCFQASNYSLDAVDYVDVLWFKNNRIIAGFEIELSKKWHGVLTRFIQLCHLVKKTQPKQCIYCVVVSFERFESIVRSQFSSAAYTNNFDNAVLKFLPLEKFLEFYSNNPDSRLLKDFKELLINISSTH